MGCSQTLPVALPTFAHKPKAKAPENLSQCGTCCFDISIVNNLPKDLLTHTLTYLEAGDILNLEVATTKVSTDGAWKFLCAKQNLTSRSSYRCVGSIIITNRPGRSLSWKNLFMLDCKSPSPRRYLSYKDNSNQKYVVFVNEQ